MALLTAFVMGTFLAAGLSIFNERLGAINLGRPDALWWFPVVGAFLFLVPGVVVLLRSDWHPVGWLMVNLGFGFLFSFGPDMLSISGLSTVERWWLWLTGTSVSAVFWTVWTALILVFPDGLVLSSRPAPAPRLERARNRYGVHRSHRLPDHARPRSRWRDPQPNAPGVDPDGFGRMSQHCSRT